MENTLMILTDKGHFKAYSLSRSNHKNKKFNLVEMYENPLMMQRMGERITDRSGNFGKGNRMMGNHGFGEKATINSELEKRVVKGMADNINFLIKNSRCSSWYFASEKTIHNQIFDKLDPSVKETLKVDITANLTNTCKMDLLHKFHIA